MIPKKSACKKIAGTLFSVIDGDSVILGYTPAQINTWGIKSGIGIVRPAGFLMDPAVVIRLQAYAMFISFNDVSFACKKILKKTETKCPHKRQVSRRQGERRMGGKIDFGAIYEQYHRDVYHFALYYTNNRQEAEDITQETFIKAMRKIESLQDLDKLKPWLLSIARHTAIDVRRKRKFVALFPDWVSDKADEGSKTVEEQVEDKGDWQELQAALLKLKPHYRAIVILRGLKELTVEETALALHCGERKVRVDYHRALNKLRKLVESRQKGWDMKDGQS